MTEIKRNGAKGDPKGTRKGTTRNPNGSNSDSRGTRKKHLTVQGQKPCQVSNCVKVAEILNISGCPRDSRFRRFSTISRTPTKTEGFGHFIAFVVLVIFLQNPFASALSSLVRASFRGPWAPTWSPGGPKRWQPSGRQVADSSPKNKSLSLPLVCHLAGSFWFPFGRHFGLPRGA